MNVFPLVGAAAGALVGALIWAAISWATGYEVGYVAWAVGGLVGLGGVLFGARGKPLALSCAALALGAIFLGKVLAAKMAFSNLVAQALGALLTREAYAEQLDRAKDFSTVPSEDAYRSFMAEHGYAADAASVTADELKTFKEVQAPRLERIQRTKPSFDKWRGECLAEAQQMSADDATVISGVARSLHPIDIIFAVLGIGTAFKIVMSRRQKEAAGPPAAGG